MSPAAAITAFIVRHPVIRDHGQTRTPRPTPHRLYSSRMPCTQVECREQSGASADRNKRGYRAWCNFLGRLSGLRRGSGRARGGPDRVDRICAGAEGKVSSLIYRPPSVHINAMSRNDLTRNVRAPGERGGGRTVPFEFPDLMSNPEPRCPCLLLLDTSVSMRGNPLAQLNEGIRTFKDQLASDGMAMQRVEVGVVTFGPVNVMTEFQTADLFQPSMLQPTGDTPMGAAISKALDMVDARKRDYRAAGVSVRSALDIPHHRRRPERRMAPGSRESPRRG